tara:strand:- start:1741 stop:2004 length:264 start_codon:yes stop_codon:yes gene_type:complete
MSDYSALVAAFEAKGGKVAKIDSGVRAIEDEKSIYKAMQNGGKVAADSVSENRDSEAKAHRRDEAFRSAKYDGWTDEKAFDYSDSAV